MATTTTASQAPQPGATSDRSLAPYVMTYGTLDLYAALTDILDRLALVESALGDVLPHAHGTDAGASERSRPAVLLIRKGRHFTQDRVNVTNQRILNAEDAATWLEHHNWCFVAPQDLATVIMRLRTAP
jgi:hypothetical protein